jgi:hypothetical protein
MGLHNTAIRPKSAARSRPVPFWTSQGTGLKFSLSHRLSFVFCKNVAKVTQGRVLAGSGRSLARNDDPSLDGNTRRFAACDPTCWTCPPLYLWLPQFEDFSSMAGTGLVRLEPIEASLARYSAPSIGEFLFLLHLHRESQTCWFLPTKEQLAL